MCINVINAEIECIKLMKMIFYHCHYPVQSAEQKIRFEMKSCGINYVDVRRW